MLEHLPKSVLQTLVSGKDVERLETVLSSLRNTEFDVVEFHKKSNLARIARTFLGERLLHDITTVELILQELSVPDLRRVCEAIGVSGPIPETRQLAKLVKRHSRKTAPLSHLFGIPFQPSSEHIESSQQTIKAPERPYKQLKSYQMTILARALQQLGPSRARCVLQMPTGTGKTRTAMELISTVLNEGNSDDVVVWLAHSAELCRQARECFQEVWQHAGQHDVEIHELVGNSSGLPFERRGRHFTIIGLQKAYAMLQRDPQPFSLYRKRVHLVVVDEAHRVMAPTYKQSTEALIGDQARVLGLTATPGRSTTDHQENLALSDFFFNNLLELSSPNHLSLFSYLRSERILSRCSRVPLETGLSYALTPAEVSAIEKEDDLPIGFLKAVGEDDARNAMIIDKIYDYAKQGRHIIFFASSVKQSRFIASSLSFLGIPAQHLDGSTQPETRKAIIDDFKLKLTHVLCNYGVLATGFDVPQIDTVIISRPTTSVILYSQMIGRGLRGPRLGGTEECLLVDVIDNIRGLPREHQAFSYFDLYWQ